MHTRGILTGNRWLALLAAVVLVVAAILWAISLSSRAGASAAEITIGEEQNGTTISVAPNSTIHLVLHSTYWQLQDVSDAKVLQSLHEPVITPDMAGHVPGSGAGTIAADFKSLGNGTAQIKATRETCGEALRCTGDQGSFSVTIVVKS